MRFRRIAFSLLLSISLLASVVSAAGEELPLNIATKDLQQGKVGVDYTAKLSANGGTPPLTWSTDPTKLPDGLKLTGTGEITGTPTTVGVFKFTAQVSDSAKATKNQGFTILVSDLSISTNALPDGKVETDYSAKLESTGGSTTLRKWRVIKGVLPFGLNLAESGDQAGTITGKPTKSGSFAFTVEVEDEGKTGESSAPNASNAPDASNAAPPSTASQQLSIVVDPQFGSTIASLLCCGTETSASKNVTSTTSPAKIISLEAVLIAIVGLAYWFAMVVIRWHRIARPSREFLRAKIASDLAELSLYPPQQEERPGERDQVRGVLLKAGLAISPKIANRSDLYRLSNFLFWSRGEEMAAWTCLHSAEVRMVACMPFETVITRLEATEQQLRLFVNDSPSIALAESIRQALTATNPTTDITRLRALLVGALTIVYQHSDASATDDISWQNKTSWLVGSGVFLLIVLTIVIPSHSILLIVGAVGGLVSRMTRSLDRKSVPTDYGASWTTIFLSPVSGALGAWSGVLLTELAVSMQVLGDVFKSDFANPCNTHTLAIAFVFGFSERLLDGVLDKIEEKTGVVPPRAASGPPSTTSPTSPNLTGGTGLAIATKDLPKGMVDSDYTGQLTATNPSGAVTWTVIDGTLPDGLDWKSITENPATIIGRPKKADTFKFTVQASDAINKTATQQLTIVINPATSNNP